MRFADFGVEILTNQLPDPRHQQVHGSHRLAVLVVTHVERLDLLWVVVDKGCCLELLLADPPLVLRLGWSGLWFRVGR